MLSAREIAEEHAESFEQWWVSHRPAINDLVHINDIKRMCELAFNEGIFVTLAEEDKE